MSGYVDGWIDGWTHNTSKTTYPIELKISENM